MINQDNLQIMIKFIIICITIISCAKAPEGWDHRIGRSWFMRIHPDQRQLGADNDWTKGFNDGCVTGYENAMSGLYRIISPRIDGWKITGRDPNNPEAPHPEIKSAKVYVRAWFDGFEHCTYQYDWWVL